MCAREAEREKLIVHASQPLAQQGGLGEDRIECGCADSGRWVGWGIHLTSIFICKDYKAAKTVQPRAFAREGCCSKQAGGGWARTPGGNATR